jgi:hypothetical protein
MERKEIKKKEVETIWDYYQWFQILLDMLTFYMQDMQHREWLIVGLLTHIPAPLTQKKVMT